MCIRDRLGIGEKKLTLLALFTEHNEEFKKRIGVDPVSYTHLDVYKRQVLYGLSGPPLKSWA